MLRLDYKSDKALHEQITDGLKELIISGALKTDEQLPSVRELSVSLTVNPNTVQRAYKDLEAEKIIYSVRGKGNFVAEAAKKDESKLKSLYDMLTSVVKELCYYGEPKEKIDNTVNNIYSERNS